MIDRIDKTSRVVRGTPSKIYEAFATADALVSWLPPRGMTGRMLVYDFREGGGYRMRLSAQEQATGKTPEDHEAGLASTLGNLAAFVERGR